MSNSCDTSAVARPSRAGGSPGPADVVVVTTSGCHLCADAVEHLRGRADVRLTVARADTPFGEELVNRYLPVMFPLVLVDGAFLSSGRLPRRKLDAVLAARLPGSPDL